MVMAYNLPEELLECSVCLEALDECSKALPCQHTFCKKCLRGVLTSKGYLQCPECRTDYPNTSIDNLPPNILLMRILGGISKSSEKNGKKNSIKENNKSTTKSAEGNKFKRSIENITVREPHARALYNFDGLEEIDLKFKKGDIIHLYQQFDENWYEGALNGKRGDVPASFIKVVVPIPDFDAEKNAALARALYNFMDKRDEDFIIRFRKGDILNVIKKIDDNWGEGILGDQHGIFPFNFVELNDIAKEKLANEKSSDEEEFGDACDSPPQGREETQEENVSPWVRLEPPKRHNLNHEKVEEDNRQSARRSLEFSTAPNTADASTTVAAKQLPRRASGSLLLETPSAATTTSVPNKSSSEAKQLRRTSSRSSRPRPRSEEELGSRNWERHPDLYIALFNYAQSRSDELALIQGEQYIVTEKFLDGWYRGFHVRSRQSGMFPGNYVGPVYSANGLQMKPVGSLPAATSPTALHPHYHRTASSPLAGTAFQFPSVPAGGRGRSQRQRSGSEPTDPVQLSSVPMATGTCNDRAAGRPENSFFNWKKYFKRQALQPPPYPLATQNQSNQRVKRASRPPPIPVEPPPPYSPPATSVPLSIPITIPTLSTALTSPILPDHTHERYRVVASFPPQSQQELELKVGDVLIVVKKRSDGWFQGKSQRTGKIGLFPASFVERF